MIKKILIFSLCCIVVAQVVYSAPSGCVDLCNSNEKIGDGFNSQTAGLSTFQTHAALQNLHQALNNQLHESQMNLDYTRPGNWSEHNQWATDGGAGKVHEERGQLEAGNAKVQYYKKNYTASFGSGNLNNAMNNFLNTQHTTAADLLSQRQVEDFRGSTKHATDISSELESRLHQLQMQMDQFNSNVHKYSLPITTTSSFETHMSQLKTRVDQVNNQIHQNSQSLVNSHSSNLNQNPQAQQHLQQLVQGYEHRMQELQSMLDQMIRQASQVSQSYQQQQQQQQQQRPTQYTERIVVPETNTHQQQQHHYEYQSHHEQQQQQQQHIKTQNGYVPTSQQHYVIPSDNLQQMEVQQQQQQQQTYVPTDRITSSQSQSHHGNQNIIRVPIHQGNRYQNYREETGHELETGNDNIQHNVYNQNTGKHVEEHWSASGHRSESIIPHHQQQQVVNDNFERIRQQHHQSGGINGGGYTSGGSSSSIYQQSGGKFRTGVLDVGQTADCDTETQSQYKSSPYHQRRYRRGIRDGYSQQTEDLTQQTEDLTQQTEDLTQQTFDIFNQQQNERHAQHGRQHEHDHDHGNRHQVGQEAAEDQRPQSQSGQIEPGNQRHHESPYDRYGQQQQQHHHNRHNHNNQNYYNRQEQAQNYGDNSQQQQQQLTQQNHHQPEQYSQQQTEGFGDYSQQPIGNLELTQQSENLNQNNYGSRQQLQSNNDANLVVGIEGAKWHSQHNSGDLTNDNNYHQQPSGITLAPPVYGHKDETFERKDNPIYKSGYPDDDDDDDVASSTTTTTNKPGFWKGVSNKISKSYEKAKDKVSDVFG